MGACTATARTCAGSTRSGVTTTMRLLLTHGYFLAEDPKEQQIMKPYPPMGILYLSSYLRGKGFDVEIYDSTFGAREELVDILRRGPAGVLGIYGNLMTRPNVLALTECAREAGWLVMLGGPEPSNYADEYLNAGADLVVAGEGELAVEMLMQVEFARERWAAIPGLLYRATDGSLSNTGPAELLHDLDAQPWPDRERIDLSLYLDTWRKHHGVGSVSVITARGCPYRCNWCSHSVYGHTHRRRSPHAVVEEIAWLVDRYHPEMLWIADDVFTIHHGWLTEYAAEMARLGIRLPFECITRADRLNEKTAQLLADLGCMRVWIGSESGRRAREESRHHDRHVPHVGLRRRGTGRRGGHHRTRQSLPARRFLHHCLLPDQRNSLFREGSFAAGDAAPVESIQRPGDCREGQALANVLSTCGRVATRGNGSRTRYGKDSSCAPGTDCHSR